MANYRFAALDARPIPAAQAANDVIFAEAPHGVLGIEVTVPALAGRCVLGNIDPQHTGGDASHAAIEEALTVPLPPDGATLATVRPDLDSVGAMACLDLLAEGVDLTPARERIAAMAACVADFRVPLDERVAAMETWLLTGAEPEGYRVRVEAERADLVRALETGEISVSLVADDRIAVVESTHRAATAVGYAHAPVVVAKNPAFRVGSGEPHTKFTVCVFELGKFADIKSALTELAAIEPGWGGSPTIGGSPQGVSSQLTTEQVVEVVARHLK